MSQYNIVEWSPGKEKKNTKNFEESISKSGFSVISSNWIYSVQKRISCQDVHSTSVLAWMHVLQSAQTPAVGSWSHRICVQCGSRPNSMLSPPEPGWTSNALNKRNPIYYYLNIYTVKQMDGTGISYYLRGLVDLVVSPALHTFKCRYHHILHIWCTAAIEHMSLPSLMSQVYLKSQPALHTSMTRKKQKTVCRSEAPVVQAP